MPKKITPQGKEDIPYIEEPSLVQSQNPAVIEANKIGQELEYIPLNTVGEYPEQNAMERSQKIYEDNSYYGGGMVNRQMYKKGGKVK